jgi:hypothetical protein
MIFALLLAAAPPLPEHVDLKTPEHQFTAKYDLALFLGRIWWKPLEAKEWAELPPRGLPADKSFTTPETIDEITADGDNLLAIDCKGRAYYAKLDTLKWTALWGPTFQEGPLYIDKAAGERIAMSHRKMTFEDIDGNPHPVIVGVTTLFVVTEGGRRLEYTDPWLPPQKRHHVCLPEHGRFRAAAVSASASTVFVIDSAGHSYTKLGDFDMMGLDPILRYGWDRERRQSFLDDGVYSLPAHPWVQQPELPGPATIAITILQTGQGNEARELRVGAPDGYWKKPISNGQWEKVLTDTPAPGQAIQPGSDVWLPPHVKVLKGTLSGQPVTLEDFAPDCSPATLVVGEARLPLHFLPDWHSGETVLTGALFAPSSGPAPALFHGRPLLEVELRLDADKVTLVERFRPRALALRVELFTGS